MEEYEEVSIPGLVRSLLADTRELVREEIALARAEVREEITAARTVAVAFGTAAIAGLIGAVVLSIAIATAIAYFLAWPAWTGYAIVAALMLGGAFVLVHYGRRRLANVRTLPRTTETVKENMAWIQSKSAAR
jgi:phage-related minor tail protein